MILDVYPKPDLSKSLVDQTVRLKQGIVVPPPLGQKNSPVSVSGVLSKQGDVVPEAITWRDHGIVTEPPRMPEGPFEKLDGTYAFMGPLFGHFGHFVTESIARLWAIASFRDELDGVIFVPKFQTEPAKLAAFHEVALPALGVDLPIILATHPTEVENLIVPPMGFGLGPMITPATEMADYARNNMGAEIKPEGADKIYLSRSALRDSYGSLLLEKRLEFLLEEEGYEVYHPQQHSFEDQIAQYRQASHIISMDGSPLHMAALMGNKDAKIGILPRRSGDLHIMFAEQFAGFCGAETHFIDCFVGNWNTATTSRIDRLAMGEISFSRACRDLVSAGMISSDAFWEDVSHDEMSELAQSIDRPKFFPASLNEPPLTKLDPLSQAAIKAGSDLFGFKDQAQSIDRVMAPLRSDTKSILFLPNNAKDPIDYDAATLNAFLDYFENATATCVDMQVDINPRVSRVKTLDEAQQDFDFIWVSGPRSNAKSCEEFPRLLSKLTPRGSLVFAQTNAAFDPDMGGSLDLEAPNLLGVIRDGLLDGNWENQHPKSISRCHNLVFCHNFEHSSLMGVAQNMHSPLTATSTIEEGKSAIFNCSNSDMADLFVDADHTQRRAFHPAALASIAASQAKLLGFAKGKLAILRGDNTFPAIKNLDPYHPRLKEALNLMRRQLDMDPTEDGLLHYLALMLRVGQPMNICWAYNQLVEMGSTKRPFFDLGAKALASRGETSSTRELLEKGLASFPNDLDLLRQVAANHRHDKNWEKAAENQEKICTLAPKVGSNWFALGHVHIKIRDFGAARDAFGKAIALEPHNPRFVESMSIAYENLRDNPSALEVFQEFDRQNDPDAKFYRAYARQLLRQKNVDEARKVIDRAIEMDPDNVEYKKWRDSQFADA